MSRDNASDALIGREKRAIGNRGRNRIKASWYKLADKPDEAMFSCYKEDDGTLRVEIRFPSK